MGVFKDLKDLLRPPPNAETSDEWEIPFGLTPKQWTNLKLLRSDGAWETFLATLDNLGNLYGEALLSASTNENLHFHRGLIVGIREAATLIDKLKQSEEEHLNERRKRAERPERAGRISALYGSPGWRNPNTAGIGRS